METDRVKGAAADFGGRVEASAGRWRDDPQIRLDGARRQASANAQEALDRAKDTLQDVTDRAGEFAADMVDQGRRYVERGSREINDRVDSNPVAAVLVASLLGFLLGVITDGRRRS